MRQDCHGAIHHVLHYSTRYVDVIESPLVKQPTTGLALPARADRSRQFARAACARWLHRGFGASVLGDSVPRSIDKRRYFAFCVMACGAQHELFAARLRDEPELRVDYREFAA